jgi:hypothetical protein
MSASHRRESSRTRSAAPATHALDDLLARWSRLGVAFDVEPSRRTPDLERLIIDTAARAGESARLVGMAATWLGRFTMLVARHRLRALVKRELPDEHAPALGLILETAGRFARSRHFDSAIAACDAALRRVDPTPQPLFEAQRGSPAMAKLAERRASDLSRRWRRWAQDIECRDDALRLPLWIMQHNPSLRLRADLGGDLRASILATLEDDASAGASELELARRCGATRRALRLALDQLELAGHVERRAEGRRRMILRHGAAA